MKEVSCRALSAVAEEWQRRGLSEHDLLRGSGVSVAKLRNKHERIAWGEFSCIMKNVSTVLSRHALNKLGRRFPRSPLIRPAAMAARMLYTVKEFYLWLHREGGGGNQMFTCVKPSARDLGGNTIEIVLSIDEHLEPCPEFFYVTEGTFAEIPRLMGFSPATVELKVTGNQARFYVTLPAGGGSLAWLRRALTWPFAARTVAKELQDAHEALLGKYKQLQAAQELLSLQAQHMQTAHEITKVIRAGRDLTQTLESVVRAMVEVGGCAIATVVLERDTEGSAIEAHARYEAGNLKPADASPVSVPLQLREVTLGTMQLWAAVGIRVDELEDFVSYVAPMVVIAVNDAIVFSALCDYRNRLEIKVEQRTRDLNAALGARERIFANINHEIRTPLSHMLLAAHAVRKHQDGLSLRSGNALQTIEAGVGELLYLIDGLLLLASSDADKLQVDRAPTDVADLLCRLHTRWVPVCDDLNINLIYNAPAACVARIDAAACHRAIGNLIGNAVKFTPSGGEVVIDAAMLDGAVSISVSDTGVGMSETAQVLAFDRFVQVGKPLRGGSGGSGIGLSIVSEIALAHGGKVAVVSEEGHGSTFTMTLPVTAGDSAPSVDAAISLPDIDEPLPAARGLPEPGGGSTSPAAPPAQFAAADGATAGAARATILVAEDDALLRQALVDLLSEEYRVLAAGDADSALLLAGRHRPDLLITDISMPGRTGLELVSDFRSVASTALAPSIVLTAHQDVESRLAGFDAGAVDYIVKPFSPAELLARVRGQMRMRDWALRLLETERLASLGAMVSGLAHELRNPANAVVNAVYPLEKCLPDGVAKDGGDVRELLDVIEAGARQIGDLSTQLLGFVRPENITCRPESLVSVIKQAVAISKGRLDGHDLSVDCAESIVPVCAGVMISRLVSILLGNAAQACGDGGEICLGARVTDGRVILEVRDSGPGVEAAIQSRIFDPFFTTKGPGLGTGLGLHLARQIAEQHQGSLRYRDTPGTGATFVLNLPLLGPEGASLVVKNDRSSGEVS